jgi:hypothetical protein
MIPPVVIRQLGLLLAGLYFVAQIWGVIPLMSSHAGHAATGPAVCGSCNEGSAGPPLRAHHAGDADDVDHHHALQDLIGLLAGMFPRAEIALARTAIASRVPRSLAEAAAVRLERPPKSFLSI